MFAKDSNMTDSDIFCDRLKASAVIAVLMIDDAEDAIPLAHALLRGGVQAMELTLRTPAAFDALHRITKDVPRMYAGVGTILTPDQVKMTKKGGAAFGVAPGMNPCVVDAAKELGLPFAPGIATPSDIEAAYMKGCRIMKFFPAEPSGGLAYLRSANAPYAHLGISYIPLGGIGTKNLRAYLECPEVIAVGGSWIATRELIRAKDWDTISRNSEQAISIAVQARG